MTRNQIIKELERDMEMDLNPDVLISRYMAREIIKYLKSKKRRFPTISYERT